MKISYFFAITAIMMLLNSALSAQPVPVNQNINDQLRQVNKLERTGNFNEAIRVCESLYAEKPGDRQLSTTLDRLYRHLEPQALVDRQLQFVKQHPNDENYRRWLGEAYLRLGNREKAYEHLQIVLKNAATDLNTYTTVARSFSSNGFWDEAAKIYMEARKVKNDPTLFAMEVAQMYEQLGKYSLATREYLLWLSKETVQWNYVEQRVFGFFKTMAKDETLKETDIAAVKAGVLLEAEQAALKLPKNGAILRVLGDLYAELNQEDKALQTYIRMEALQPQDGRTLIEFGNNCLARARYQTAILAFNQLIQSYPKSAFSLDARLKLADCQMKLNNFDGAISAYQLLIKDIPGTQQAQQAMIRIGDLQLDALGNPDAAYKTYQDFLNTYRSSQFASLVLLRAGETRLRVGQIAEAEKIWCNFNFPPTANVNLLQRFQFPGAKAGTSAGLEHESQSDPVVQAQFYCALIPAFKGDFSPCMEALDAFVKAHAVDDLTNDALQWAYFINLYAQKNPGRLKIYFEGFLLEVQNKYAEAIAKYSELVTLPASAESENKPDLTDYALFKLGQLRRMVAKENPETAIKDFRTLISYYPESNIAPQAQMQIAEIYESDLKQRDKALIEYEAVLTRFPNSIYVEEARHRIQLLNRRSNS